MQLLVRGNDRARLLGDLRIERLLEALRLEVVEVGDTSMDVAAHCSSGSFD